MIRFDTQEIEDMLSQIAETVRTAPLTDEMKKCRDHVHAQYEQEFDMQAGPQGESWEPWHFTSEPGFEHDTLFVSGALKSSYTRQGEGHVEEIKDREMRTGSELPYAWIHDEGATIMTGVPLYGRQGGYLPAGSIITIPQRRVSGVSEATIGAWTDTVADGLLKKISEI